MFTSVPGPLQCQEPARRDQAGRGTDEEPALPAHGLQFRRWDGGCEGRWDVVEIGKPPWFVILKLSSGWLQIEPIYICIYIYMLQ